MAELLVPAPASDQIAPTSIVDSYKIIRRIGRGGMGEVYLARDLVLGRRVAIKVIRASALADRKATERFLAEARATASFNHPNIVTLYAAGELRGQPYVALEYVEGQTLAQRLADGPMGTMEAVRVAAAVAQAVREAHHHGVAHRDLKPENVIIGRDGRPRVLDFGLARLVSDVGSAGKARGSRHSVEPLEPPGDEVALRETVGIGSALVLDPGAPLAVTISSAASRAFDTSLCGTPLYMAPEQWRQEGATTASDVWAFGLDSSSPSAATTARCFVSVET